MRVVVQRSKEARVEVDGQIVGEIKQGLVLLVGFRHEDTEADIKWMAEKVVNLRIFEDEAGKMNLSLLDAEARSSPSPNSPCTETAAKAADLTSWRQPARSRQSGCMISLMRRFADWA